MREKLHYLLMANHLLFRKELLARMKDTDLTSGQPKVLEYLLYHDGAVQKEIAEACYIEPATITSLLLRMENKGLVIRKNLNGNRRNLYVYLSEKGRELANQIEQYFEKIETNALVDFSESEKEKLIELLLKINQNMSGRGDAISEQDRNY